MCNKKRQFGVEVRFCFFLFATMELKTCYYIGYSMAFSMASVSEHRFFGQMPLHIVRKRASISYDRIS